MNPISWLELQSTMNSENTSLRKFKDINAFCQAYMSPVGGLEGTGAVGSDLGLVPRETSQPIVHWSGEECQTWASDVLQRRGLHSSNVNLWHLSLVSGSQLLMYTKKDFCDLAGASYGPVLYREFQKLKSRESQACQGHTPQGHTPQYYHDSCECNNANEGTNNILPEESSYPDSGLESVSNQQRDYAPLYSDPHSMNFQEMSLEEQQQYWKVEGEAYYQREEGQEYYQREEGEEEEEVGAREKRCCELDPELLEVARELQAKILSNAKRRRYRQPTSWEFVVRLLCDPRTNPSVVSWEEREEATFRLVQPDVIALMWGQGGAVPKQISYYNFARSLRYHYSTKAMKKVSEHQLVYGLGPEGRRYLKDIETRSSWRRAGRRKRSTRDKS